MADIKTFRGVNMNTFNVGDLNGATIEYATDHGLSLYIDVGHVTSLDGRGYEPTDQLIGRVVLNGAGFTYDANDQIVGGVVNEVLITFVNLTTNDIEAGLEIRNFSLDASIVADAFLRDDTQSLLSAILASDDTFTDKGSTYGADLSDFLQGFGGNDTISSYAGSDTVYGGAGNDVIDGGSFGDSDIGFSNYLRGDEGDDRITGGAGFDDINGNMGDDTCAGGDGGDWVVGGKDQDRLSGDAGNDIVYGNLGDDTCDGGSGDDTVRGGKGNDVVTGGDGNDWLSGDRGDDTMTGGAGADVFHTFSGAGIDRVTDFQFYQGDRIMVDPGTQYAIRQEGADTIIDLGGGDAMVLVGVTDTETATAWIFGA